MNLRVSRAVASQLRFLFLALAAAAVLCAVAPTLAFAEGNVAYVRDSSGNVTNYTDENAAIEAAYGKGNTLVLLKNWDRKEAVNVASGKELTIDMNGYRIKTEGSSRVIYLRGGSTLTLTSSRTWATISYVGYDPEDGSQEYKQVVSGGLITGGGAYDGGGIKMDAGSRLKLDGVTVAGNKTTSSDKTAGGAGICAADGCTVELTGGAKVQNNCSSSAGGGIYAAADNVTIAINNARVDANRATRGGGIFVNGSNNKVTLNNNGTLNGNVATAGGGGIVIGGSGFSLVSEDKTGSISNNKANGTSSFSSKDDASGGGIHVRDKPGDASVVKGLKVCDNYSAYDGGGIELDQESTTISQCTVTGNTADKDGGGICLYAKKCTIDGCTITKNACDLEGKNYEGGGVFVSYHYDANMSGVCYIKGNTRGKDSGNADDVFLSTISGQTGYAYITGKLEKGSTVGVRTGITGDRMIAQDFSCDTKDCFFIDLSGYYVSYGTDHNGDAWQRHRTQDFAVKVNGSEAGRYKQGASVSVSADSTADSKDADKVFWHWDRDKTTGLNPIDSYITESGSYKSGLSFAMPQNDVNLVAVYADRVSSGELTVTAPKAGEELSPEATFVRTDNGTGGAAATTVKVSWYEVASDGSEQQVSGAAKLGTTYVARIWIDDDAEAGLHFGSSKGTTVTVKSGDEESAEAAEVQCRDDGSLYVKTAEFKTAKPTVVSIDTVYTTTQVGTTKINFLNSLPIEVTAKTNIGTTVKLHVNRSEDAGLGDLIKDGVVAMPEGGKITVYVPVSSDEDEVKIPMDMNTVSIEVTVTEAPETVETPTVDVPGGIYSVTDDPDKFVDGKLKVTASCATDGATIKYRVDHYDGNDWVQGDVQSYADAIYLARDPQAVRMYDLVIWAEKDSISSDTNSVYYIVNDLDSRTVTVKQTDTGITPDTTKLKDCEVRKGSPFTIEAPEREGYKFEKWVVGDEEYSAAALTLDAVNENTTVTAVYNPVVSEINVDIDAPVAHGALMQAASTVKVKAGGSDSWTDITSLLSHSHGNPRVTWTPEGDGEGNAAHQTGYTASLSLEESSTATATYIFTKDAVIDCKGERIDSALAYIAEAADGSKSLCMGFPTTGPWEYPVLSGLSDVQLSYAEAWEYQEAQDAGDEVGWSLPRRVLVTAACGESVPLDIVWNQVSGFDKTKLAAQEFEVTGTIAFPDYIDASDKEGQPISNVVTVKVTVAAPDTVAAPTASLVSGIYAGTQSVELACETGGATIRYTTDGSEPDESSPVYDGAAIEVAHNTVIKAKAFREAMVVSETVTFAYTITHAVSFDSAGGTDVVAQTVTDGEAATEPAAPTRAGYDFAGWTLDGAVYDFSTPVTGDLTITASWEKKDGGSDVDPDVDPDDPDVDPDADPDDKGDEQPDSKKDDSKKHETLPGTGDASAFAGIVAASGAALAALGARSRRKR